MIAAPSLWSIGTRRCAYLLVALAFAVCTHAQIAADTWVAVPEKADPLLTNLTIPANAPSRGMWSPVYNWPLNGLHATLLPDGRVLTFGTSLNGNTQDGRYFDVWDPALGFTPSAHNTVYDSTRQDSFCAAAAYLSDGSLLISGGNGSSTSNVYQSATHTSFVDSARLSAARWYSTMITLADGRLIMLGGMQPYTEDMRLQPDQAISRGWPSMTPEIYAGGQWRSLLGAYSRLAFGPDYLRTSYPRAWVAPNGQVFGISTEQMWYLNPDANGGNGSIASAGTFKGPYSAQAPVNVGATNTAVMFAPGKILQVGGNGGFNGDELPASNMATVVDINGGAPVLTEQPRMNYARRYPNAIVLASGDVVITGGATYGNNVSGQPSSAVMPAEIWRAASGSWSVGASAARYRGYHSITTLLTNGTVLSTGGGTPGPVLNLNAEIYYPPYLFRSVNGNAELAPRPVIIAISALAHASGDTFQVDMDSEALIASLVLVGGSSGTHSFNSGQRRVELAFTQQRFRLTATLPNNFATPPGYYQLVAIDASGVPSPGVIIGIGQNQAPPPGTPAPYTPPSLEQTIHTPALRAGESVTYSIEPTVGTLYSWEFSDGSAATPFLPDASVAHVFAEPGLYVVTLTARAANGAIATRTFVQAVATERTAAQAVTSTPIIAEHNSGAERVWVVNPDSDTVAVVGRQTGTLIAEITVGTSPRTLALAPNGRIWVTNKLSSTISVIDATSLVVSSSIDLPPASQPHGLVFAPDGSAAFVVLEAGAKLLKLDPASGAQIGAVDIGLHARHLAIDGSVGTLLVSRFVTPPLPGESTAIVDTSTVGAEVLAIDPTAMTLKQRITLRHSDKVDTEIQGSGIPNYLGAPVISPDGRSAWVPSKQDNLTRGQLRNGLPLDFQNSVRAISSRIDMVTLSEDYARRFDHDNSGVGAAVAFHPNGVFMFVALETSREVAVVNAINGGELLRIETGIAPQGVAVSTDGNSLYVQEFIDRSVRIVDLRPLLDTGQLTTVATVVRSTAQDKLSATVLQGKSLFYDAADTRLARDGYLSCASCHNDGGDDGRVWDMTGFGEGLRNTIALNGRGGMLQGLLHWSGNFDEVQDFEKQIRDLAGGTGLMHDADYNAGTRNQPLGDNKAGLSASLDQLAAYLASLQQGTPSPLRNADGTLTTAAIAGKEVFASQCSSCHGGSAFTLSSDAASSRNVGTINTASGQRLGAQLTALDVPTLRDAWNTAPYLHNGSAATIAAAVQAHTGLTLNESDLDNVAAYVQQIGSGEIAAPASPQVQGTGAEEIPKPPDTAILVVSRTEQMTEPWIFRWLRSYPRAARQRR